MVVYYIQMSLYILHAIVIIPGVGVTLVLVFVAGIGLQVATLIFSLTGGHLSEPIIESFQSYSIVRKADTKIGTPVLIADFAIQDVWLPHSEAFLMSGS